MQGVADLGGGDRIVERWAAVIVVSNRFYVAEGREAESETRFQDRACLVDVAPGLGRYEVLRPESAGASYAVMTHEADESSFRAWTASEAFRQDRAHGKFRELLAKPGGLEMHGVLED